LRLTLIVSKKIYVLNYIEALTHKVDGQEEKKSFLSNEKEVHVSTISNDDIPHVFPTHPPSAVAGFSRILFSEELLAREPMWESREEKENQFNGLIPRKHGRCLQ
jgi:hypothetical protein